MGYDDKFKYWPDECITVLKQHIPNNLFCAGYSYSNFGYTTEYFCHNTVFAISYNNYYGVFTIWNALIHKKIFDNNTKSLSLGKKNIHVIKKSSLNTRTNEIKIFEKYLKNKRVNGCKEHVFVVGKNVFYEFCKNYKDYYIYFLEEYNRIFDRHNSENNNDASERKRELISRYKRDKMFRDNVLERFDNTCIVCGIKEKAVLEAAHIKSVAGGGNDDATNGYCLCSNHHRLFDSGKLEIDLDNREYYFKNLNEDNLVTNSNEEHHLHLPKNFK